ncbi:MAG: hypothetical protein ACLTX3_08795 [Lachnospiraceae bacterium]
MERLRNIWGGNASQFVRAFRVRNQTLDDAFWKNYKKNGYHKSDIHYYYHGTRNMNCLSIMKNGLLLNPNAPRTGAMFGHGIYPGKQSTEESALYFFAWILICQGSFRTGISLCTEICIRRSNTCIPLGTLYVMLYCKENRTT